MVLHLVSAADGADQDYDDKIISKEEALKMDSQTSNSWNGHSKFIVVKNIPGKDFNNKIGYCLTSARSLVGLPTENKFYQKFLLEVESIESVQFPADVKIENHMLTECFLKSSRSEVQIRLSKRVKVPNNRIKME